MKPSLRLALTLFVVGLVFAALGAAVATIGVRVFKMSFFTAWMAGLPLSYFIGLLLVRWLGFPGPKDP